MLAAGVVGTFQIGKLPAALHELRAELGLGLVAAGWVISTISAVGVATGMVWGMLADRLGHRRVLLGGMALIAVGSLAGAASQGLATLLVTRMVEGIGYIAIITAAPMFVTPLSAPRDRDVALAIWSFYIPLGMSGMVVLSPPLLPIGSWRGLWVFSATLAVVVMAVVAAATRNPRGTATPAASRAGTMWSGMWRTLASPGPPTLAVAFGAYSLVYLSVTSFLPTFLIERRGTEPDTAAVMVALVIFMNVPGCYAGGWLMKRRAPAWLTIAIGYAGMLVCALGIYSEDLSGSTRYALALCLPFFGGLIPPTVLARAHVHAASPALVATTIGLIVQVISLGQLIGPPILAALVSRAGDWQDATYLTVSACATGLLSAAVLWRLDKQRLSASRQSVASSPWRTRSRISSMVARTAIR